jgi:hypothetical protein
MNPVLWITVAAVLTLSVGASFAQFVKGNEAITVMADGSKKVETPPLPTATLGTPCPATKAGCAGGGWKMIESTDGLVECTEVFARQGTCRPSTYGADKRSRAWIVKVKGVWTQCERPDIASRCVSLKSFPVSAVQ